MAAAGRQAASKARHAALKGFAYLMDGPLIDCSTLFSSNRQKHEKDDSPDSNLTLAGALADATREATDWRALTRAVTWNLSAALRALRGRRE